MRAVPEGAYYLFVGYRSVGVLADLGPTEAAMKLTTDYQVACVPGDNFYLGEAAKTYELSTGRSNTFWMQVKQMEADLMELHSRNDEVRAAGGSTPAYRLAHPITKKNRSPSHEEELGE